MANPLRVVIDPNVWISGLIRPSGAPGDVVRAVMAGTVIAVVTPYLLEELSGVLLRPKFRRWVSLADATAFIETLTVTAELYLDVEHADSRTRDPKDDYLVALADSAHALIITGDADLLEADLVPPAITPRQLLHLLT